MLQVRLTGVSQMSVSGWLWPICRRIEIRSRPVRTRSELFADGLQIFVLLQRVLEAAMLVFYQIPPGEEIVNRKLQKPHECSLPPLSLSSMRLLVKHLPGRSILRISGPVSCKISSHSRIAPSILKLESGRATRRQQHDRERKRRTKKSHSTGSLPAQSHATETVPLLLRISTIRNWILCWYLL